MCTFLGSHFFWVWDGNKHVCFDNFPPKGSEEKCLVYTFGLNKDWSFEKDILSLGNKDLGPYVRRVLQGSTSIGSTCSIWCIPLLAFFDMFESKCEAG